MSAHWYAASLQSNHENQAQKYLQSRGLEHYLPTYCQVSVRKDRAVTLQRPLFPGYVFVRLEIPGTEKIQVLQCPGACGLIGFSGRPTPIDDDVIQSLQILTGVEDSDVKPHPLVRAGQKVVVTSGPFRNAVGVLCDSTLHRKQLVVEVSFLGRAVAVPIDALQVRPLL